MTIRTYEVPKEAVPAPLPMPTAADMTAAPGPSAMRWEVPEGWTTAPEPGAMRTATLFAGEGEQRIEVAISSLAGPAGGVPANVNRWRGQVGLSPASDAELESIVMPIEARGTSGVVVDLLGPAPADGGEPTRMLAAIFPTATDTWFVKTMASSSALEPHRDAFMALCATVSFDGAPMPAPSGAAAGAASAPASGGGAGGTPRWSTAPEGWSEDATPAAMATASFTIRGEGGEARMTVTPLGGAQDLMANVNRWRGQVGLGPAATPEEAGVRSIVLGGSPGHLVDIVGSTHIIGAFGIRGGTTWYFKLSGPDPLVASQRSAFESFLDTVRFE